MATIEVDEGEFRRLLDERDHLRRQVGELQLEGTKAKDGSLYRMVRRFHAEFGHAIRHTPEVPPDEEVKVRLALITEEFLELTRACVKDSPPIDLGFLRAALASETIEVDLPELVDALGDLAYVVEGTAATFGVDMRPVMDEIQRSNMAKVANGALGKPTKPDGWRPPDIVGVLEAQGWKRERTTT